MRIKNHKLDTVEFTPARWTGGVITPEIVVLHDTAGRLEKGNSARYLANNDAKVSVHFIIERDGTITQQVPTNRRANHAGQSSFHGRKNCNDFSIGIEIVNPGKMKFMQPNSALAWWGEKFPVFKSTSEPDRGLGIEFIQTPEHGAGAWMSYSSEQIEAVSALLAVLFRDIKTLRDVTTHWYISPGRKVDTNPLFPLEQIRARILGRDDPALVEAEEGSDVSDLEFARITAPSGLNMRRWPSFNPNVITTIPDGAVVPVQRRGHFGGRDWFCVTYAGQDGWIVAAYAQHQEVS